MPDLPPQDPGDALPEWKRELLRESLRRIEDGESSRDAYEVIAELRKNHIENAASDGFVPSEQQLEILRERRRVIDEGNAEYDDWENALSELSHRRKPDSENCGGKLYLTPQQRALLRDRLKRLNEGEEELFDLEEVVDEIERELDRKRSDYRN